MSYITESLAICKEYIKATDSEIFKFIWKKKINKNK